MYVPGGGMAGVVGSCGVPPDMGGCIVGCADCSNIRISPSLLCGPIAMAAADGEGGGGGRVRGGRVGGARDTGVGPDNLGPGGTSDGFV